MKSSITIGVRHDGAITPKLLWRISARLQTKEMRDKLRRIQQGTLGAFTYGQGDGIAFQYPPARDTALRVECEI